MLIVVAIALFAPWYSVTTSQVVPEVQNYTTQLEAPTTSLQMETVYTLPNPITIPAYGGAQNIVSALTAPWVSSSFNLQVGSSISATVIGQTYVIGIYENFSPYHDVDFTLNGKVPSPGNAVVPESGPYVVEIVNLNSAPITINAISVVESMSQSVEAYQTLTTYTTTPLTQYSQTTVSPYTILGGIASAVILVLLALVLVLSILLDRDIITLSTKRHRKRRKR